MDLYYFLDCIYAEYLYVYQIKRTVTLYVSVRQFIFTVYYAFEITISRTKTWRSWNQDRIAKNFAIYHIFLESANVAGNEGQKDADASFVTDRCTRAEL